MENQDYETEERLQLALERIAEIPKEECVDEQFRDFFGKAALYILKVVNYQGGAHDLESLNCRNEELYGGLKAYDTSYANPDYSDEKLGIYGGILSFVASELYGLGRLIADNKQFDIVILLELFIEIYCLFIDDKRPHIKHIESAVYYYAFDYIEFAADERLHEMLTPCTGTAYDIVMNADLSNTSYLYGYGEYISDNEIKLSAFMNTLSDKEIEAMAATFTNGFRRGFDTMHIEFEGKKTVEVRYFTGQERLVRETVRQFKALGLDTILTRGETGRLIKNGLIKQGFNSISSFNQFEYDHKADDAIFLDKRFVEKKLQAYEKAYKAYEEAAHVYAGPAVIECFGENEFSPVSKDTAYNYTDEQTKLRVEMARRMGEIRNGYIPGDKYSFTIIAYPIPEIGDRFEEIFRETVRINNLDNDTYTAIHQAIIDTMDVAVQVRVEGKSPNVTDMYVATRKLEHPERESQFENCVADVNIPLGEVFTSPVLTGTHGVLNVSRVYINGLLYKDLKITFEDGVVKDYTCGNFEEEDKNKKYIKDNILFDHETLPIGEFAIGTNTEAFVMAEKFDILGKLPILIIEKTGPHFAVGDTCYSHAEDNPVYNPDGKEIVSRENEFSAKRFTEPENAYFNCHIDITIPYGEIGRLYTVNEDGSETDIIVDGRFVLPGTEKLNEAFS